MRVLFLIDGLRAGGAERSLEDLVPALLAEGVAIDVAYFEAGGSVHDRLRAAGAETFHIDASERVARIRGSVALIRKRRPALVHTTLFEADIAGRAASAIARVPVVSSLVNVAYGAEQLLDERLSTVKVKAAAAADIVTARAVRRFHALTADVARTMGRRLLIPRNRIEVIPRGRDAEKLGTNTPERRARARRGLDIEDRTKLVFAAARREHQKGLDILIEAFARLTPARPEARLAIAGREGNQSRALDELAQRLGIRDRVSFLGARDDVPELICAADAFVLPSRWEGFGGVLLEAMALEAPIVVSDLPSTREVVDGYAAFSPPGDAVELERAISVVLDDAVAARARAADARQRFLQRFTTESVARAMIGFYGRALVP